jgi:outer membrane protein OmpA-like peptidoglycan-associated protein
MRQLIALLLMLPAIALAQADGKGKGEATAAPQATPPAVAAPAPAAPMPQAPAPQAAVPPAAPQACPRDMMGQAGAAGTLTCTCAAGAMGGSVWGSAPYTADSAICRAARHAGVVPAEGGTVTVRMLPGEPRYLGSTRNGVQSLNFGAYRASYTFEGIAPVAAGPQPCPDDATPYAGTAEQLACTCPETSTPRGSVWGTDIYTADSAICAAALHAGAVTRRGGLVTLRMMPGRPRYPGTTRNGVQSIDFPDYGASYAFVGVSAGPQICPDSMVSYANTDETLTCVCTGEAVLRSATVWGSGPYTADSRVCRAARHAGVVPVTGGSVTVRMLPGEPRYAASSRNGVQTMAFGDYGSSFRFEGAQNTAAAAPVQAPVADSLRRTGRVSLYVTFRTGSAELDAAAGAVLAQVRDALNEDPALRLRLVGHTDNQGGPNINMPLSQRRAQAVRDWLVRNGIAAERLATEGRGQGEPIADNNTDAGRSLNRRVEAVRVE